MDIFYGSGPCRCRGAQFGNTTGYTGVTGISPVYPMVQNCEAGQLLIRLCDRPTGSNFDRGRRGKGSGDIPSPPGAVPGLSVGSGLPGQRPGSTPAAAPLPRAYIISVPHRSCRWTMPSSL